LDEAIALFGEAARLQPDDQLYVKNRDNLGRVLDFRRQSQQRADDAREAIRAAACEAGLTPEQVSQVNSLYWDSDTSVKELQACFSLAATGPRSLNSVVIPTDAGMVCPNCLIEMVYKNRTARSAQERVCLGCGHQERGWCRCSYCTKREEERRRKAEEARRLAQLAEFRSLQERYCEAGYVEWAVGKLSRREKLFLRSFLELSPHGSVPCWQEICERAGVVAERTYVERLCSLKLLMIDPDGKVVSNSALEIDMLEVVTVRRIIPSLRFDVFQRDGHACQYCGRTPPDVVLVVDHLIPVAQGGTDDFDNLVTSCEDCNSGKSDKLIGEFTGGHGKEEWSEHIREKRRAVLRERRARLNGIRQHWMDALGRRSLSRQDDVAILSFLERYEPDWIEAAIAIAARKEIGDYIRYTAGILRRWAKDGPPEHITNPDAGLAKRPATPKQIAYIASLLERAGLKLDEVCSRCGYDQLTMLDARNIISALTEEIDE